MLFRIKNTSTNQFVGSIYLDSEKAFQECNQRNYNENCNHYRVVRFLEDQNW